MTKVHDVFTLCLQQYGESTKKVLIIPHRTKQYSETIKMVSSIAHSFYKTLHHTTGVTPKVHGLMISEIIELVQEIIKHEGYVYNQECFLGIDFQNQVSTAYVIDEKLTSCTSQEVVQYISQINHIYNPLLILNPLNANDAEGYAQIEDVCGGSTIIGKNRSHNNISPALEVVQIHEKADLVNERQHRDVCASKHIKYYARIISESEAHIKKVIEALGPDFIEHTFIPKHP